ncbi:TetR/AcrR family transcriptional regulator [Catenulispora sp. NF23]|uniref:TetR/AcrR family transcriptional regulator n=1 Tax=Catenulispora pinistramenti TaxID=2705254 RepID=UPI001BABB60D|nr:TetR/AcrR family transcriptional regulator [Catenulispora pinistramenti]MBS2539251.1 TetR/AcrR family transcriptional regulator [Catenulispora pinistramenti]
MAEVESGETAGEDGGPSNGRRPGEKVRQRGPRRDAADNRDRVLAAAATAVRREGIAVPMATIAADAGVGVGTVYRHFPCREALLNALTHRSFELVLAAATRAAEANADAGEPGVEAVRRFLDRTVEHGGDLVMPMRGGPPALDERTVAVQSAVHAQLRALLQAGVRDGSIRADVTAGDLVIFGALLTERLPHVADWNTAARRVIDVYAAGLAPTAPPLRSTPVVPSPS